MIPGDRKLGFQYRDLIIEQLKKEINPSKERLQKMINRLNNASSDELERTYEAFEELEKESHSKLFTSHINILSELEEKLPYSHETYVSLNKEHYDLMLSHCWDRMEYLKQYIDDDFSGKRFEYMESERLFYWLQKLNPN